MAEFLAGIAVSMTLVVILWIFKLRKKRSGKHINVYATIENIRSAGELVVYKVKAKEIVTTAEHWFGELGKKYFKWLVSAKKMAMIFEFDIEFKFNLRSEDFKITQYDHGKYELLMPKCYYDIKIQDICFYDEQSSKFLPWLLPDLINKAVGMGFDEADKNRLKDEAKLQAGAMSKKMALTLWPEIMKSCENTLTVLARGFGARDIRLNFNNASLTHSGILAESKTIAEPNTSSKVP